MAHARSPPGDQRGRGFTTWPSAARARCAPSHAIASSATSNRRSRRRASSRSRAWRTAVTLLRRRLVGGRCAGSRWRRRRRRRSSAETDVGLVREAGPVQRREQEVTAWSPVKILPVRFPLASRSQPEDHDRGMDRPSRDRPPQYSWSAKRDLLAGDPLAPLDETAGSARHDLVVILSRSRACSHGGFRGDPVVAVEARTSPSRPPGSCRRAGRAGNGRARSGSHPVERLDRPSSTSMLSMSRWFVGSSSTRQFAPESISRQSSSRVRSPPGERPDLASASGQRNRTSRAGRRPRPSYIALVFRTVSTGVSGGLGPEGLLEIADPDGGSDPAFPRSRSRARRRGSSRARSCRTVRPHGPQALSAVDVERHIQHWIVANAIDLAERRSVVLLARRGAARAPSCVARTPGARLVHAASDLALLVPGWPDVAFVHDHRCPERRSADRGLEARGSPSAA